MKFVLIVMFMFGSAYAQEKAVDKKAETKPIAKALPPKKAKEAVKVEEAKLEEAKVEAEKAEAAPPLDSDPVAKRPSRPMQNWEMRASVGLDLQVSNSELSPRYSWNEPEDEAKIGGAVGVYIRNRWNHRFGLSTGGEIVSRQMEQDYDWGWFISDGGSTRYDVISFEIPLYAEIYLGSQGAHTIYFGPKIATPIYEHCQNAITDPNLGKACMTDAARKIFVPIQVGYHLWMAENFGMTFFIEASATPIIDKEELEATSTRTGALATFYF